MKNYIQKMNKKKHCGLFSTLNSMSLLYVRSVNYTTIKFEFEPQIFHKNIRSIKRTTYKLHIASSEPAVH